MVHELIKSLGVFDTADTWEEMMFLQFENGAIGHWEYETYFIVVHTPQFKVYGDAYLLGRPNASIGQQACREYLTELAIKRQGAFNVTYIDLNHGKFLKK